MAEEKKLTGNKGEWSEVYTLLYLLSRSNLFSADENLEKTDYYVSVKEILRSQLHDEIKYIANDTIINIINASSDELILSISKNELAVLGEELFEAIKNGKGNSFSIEETLEQKLRSIQIKQVKEKSTNKGDINLLIYEPEYGLTANKKFSIKSLTGSKPTLFNSHTSTNIRYSIVDSHGNAMPSSLADEINSVNTRHKYIDRIKKISNHNYNINYQEYCDNTFYLNLQMISSDMPQIMAFCVLEKYINRITKMREVIKNLETKNPLDFDLTAHHPFYQHRMITFLTEAALGMTSKTPWTGIYDAVGGILIVKNDRDVLCYHLVDFNKFKQYLLNRTSFDNPSGGKHGYGSVYYIDGKSYINLNFQIRA